MNRESDSIQTYTRGADLTVFTWYRFVPRQPINWELHVWRAAAIIWMVVGFKYGAIRVG